MRRDAMRRKLDMQHKKKKDLDPLRYLDAKRLEAEIWKHVAENVPRETVLDNSVNSVTNTVKGFLTGRRPTITVTSKNPINQAQQTVADKVERIGYALFDTINRERSTALEDDVVDHGAHRGVIIIQCLWLSPEERGEEVVEIESQLPGALTEDALPEVVVQDEGQFAVLVKVLDALDCYWELDDATGKPVEFVHEYKLTRAALARRYPHVRDAEWFREHYPLTPDEAESPVGVTDYWDDEINAILVDDLYWLKKPTPHDYYCLPVVVELVDPETRRDYVDGMSVREGVPFCHNIRPYVMGYSRINPHENWHFVRNDGTNADGTVGIGVSEFKTLLDFSPFGQLIPLAIGEKIELVPVAPLVPTLEALKAFYADEIAKGSFNLGILTGLFPAEPPSGMSVVRMQMATTARMKPMRKADARALGRALLLVCKMFATNWDRGPDGQVVLSQLAGQSATQYEELTFTEEDFKMVSSIYCDINPDVELDKEERDASIIQQFTTGLVPQRVAIERLGQVQDAQMARLEIAADQESMANPQVRAALALKYFELAGIPVPQPAQPPLGVDPNAQMAAAAPQAAAPLPTPVPGGAMPGQVAAPPPPGVDMMGSGEMAGMDPSQMDPEMLMQLMAMMQQGGGAPIG